MAQTMKHSPSVMVGRGKGGGGVISANSTGGLHFLQPGTTMNGAKCLDLLKDKLNIYMVAIFLCTMVLHVIGQSK